MITLSLEPGTPPGDQLPETFQAVLVVPVHVFWANASMETINAMIAKRVNDFFMVFYNLVYNYTIVKSSLLNVKRSACKYQIP